MSQPSTRIFDTHGKQIDTTKGSVHVLAYGQTTESGPQRNKPLRVDKHGRLASPHQIDNAGRIRTSNPHTVFELTHTTMAENTAWAPLFKYSVDSSGTTSDVFYTDDSMVGLKVDTSDSYRRHASKRKFVYQPGKSVEIKLTGCLNARVGGNDVSCHTMIGCYDDNDGIFFEHNDTSGYVVVRRAGVDTKVVQDSWNKDTMDGNGLSSVTVDWTKTQFMMYDYQWQGVGDINFYMHASGELIPIHTVLNTNNATGAFMKWGNLPIRYETSCNSITTSGEMTFICGTVISEGVYDKHGVPHSAYSDYGTSLTTDQETHLLSIRINPASGVANSRIIFNNYTAISTKDKDCLFKMYLTPSQNTGILASPSWIDVSYSCVQFDGTVTSSGGGLDTTGSYLVKAQYISDNTSQISDNLSNLLYFGTDVAGTRSDIMTMTMTILEAGGGSAACTTNWYEDI